MNNKFINYFNYIIYFFILLLPVALISGPFLPDLFICLSGIILLIVYFSKNNQFKIFDKNLIIIFITWCLYILFSSLISTNIVLSLESSLFYFRFGFLVLVVYHCCSNSEIFIKYFTYILLISFIILFIDSVYQFFNIKNLLGWEYISKYRISSFFRDELVMGSYVSRLTPLLIGLILYSFKTKEKYFIICFILLISNLLVLLSGERVAFFYILAFDLFLLLCARSFRKFLSIFFIVLITMIIFILSNTNSISNRIIDQTMKNFNFYDNSDPDIINKTSEIFVFSKILNSTYQSAFAIFKDNIVFGVGPKNYRYVCANEGYFHYIGKTPIECLTHPHNTYFQLLSETGIIGFIFIFSIFLFLLLKLINFLIKYNFKKERVNQLNEINYIIIFCFFITLFPIVPTGNFFNNWLSCIYFLPIGFYYFIRQVKNII